MSKHSLFSASSSERWINCPASVKKEQLYENVPSSYAEEGTLAHSLSEVCFRDNVKAKSYVGKKIDDKEIDEEMAYHVQKYVDYVQSFIKRDQHKIVGLETQVEYSDYVKDGFGTVDCFVADIFSGVCHIFDLKYGKGVRVSAEKNTQLQLYALGVLQKYSVFFEFSEFVLHIIQPRVTDGFSKWKISTEDLIKFGKYVQEKSEEALGDNPIFNPGDKQCKFCRHKENCKDLKEYTIGRMFQVIDKDDDEISLDERIDILNRTSLIDDFLRSNSSHLLNRAKLGSKINGYKLVEKRTVRTYTDYANGILEPILGDRLYEKKRIPISKVERLVSYEILKHVVHKPKGELTLVKDTDRRSEADSEFAFKKL